MATALRLYEAVDAYHTALEWLEEHEDEIIAAGGEMPPELEAILDQAEGDLKEKVKRVALMVQNLAASADAAKAERDRLARTARSYEHQADALKAYLKDQLDRAGVRRVDTPVVKVRVQRASRPSITTVGEEIPERFQRMRVELDGNAAYEHLKGVLGKDAPDAGEKDGLRYEYSYSPVIW